MTFRENLVSATTMAFSEAKQPRGLYGPCEKVLVAARYVSSARGRKGSSWSASLFSAAGKTQAGKMADLPGYYPSGEGSDGNRSGHDDAVALSQEKSEKASRKRNISAERQQDVKCRCSDLYSLCRSISIYALPYGTRYSGWGVSRWFPAMRVLADP